MKLDDIENYPGPGMDLFELHLYETPLDAGDSITGVQEKQESEDITTDDYAMQSMGPDVQNVIESQLTGNDVTDRTTTPYNLRRHPHPSRKHTQNQARV